LSKILNVCHYILDMSLAVSYDLNSVSGLGPKRIAILKQSGIKTPLDLLYYLPRTYSDRTQTVLIKNLCVDQDSVVCGEVREVRISKGAKARATVEISDGTGSLSLVFFHYTMGVQKKYQPGRRVAVFGKVQDYNGLQMVHPETEFLGQKPYVGRILPIYSLSEAMRASRMEQNFFRNLLESVWNQFGSSVTEPLSESLCRELKILPQKQQLQILHFPSSMVDLQKATESLKRSRMLPVCIRMWRRRKRRLAQGCSHLHHHHYADQLISNLPFALTTGQTDCIRAMKEGLTADRQYHVLVQGDVGSGKTIPAIWSALAVAESGYQVLVMVPTEILALQHYRVFKAALSEMPFAVALVTGRLNGEERRLIQQEILNQKVQIVIGTHALFSESMNYPKVGLVIVDEQHRFGVVQREKILAKAAHPDLIIMSATPIPRSLVMTFYGDLEQIIIPDKPLGRKEIRTRIVNQERREAMKTWILTQTALEKKVYWVLPRIEKQETGLSVEGVFAELKSKTDQWEVLGVHGKMSSEEKEKVLLDFAGSGGDILVATTVIEVGVDIPAATIMVIEGADRFGLAQLHQLRGRVGRGQEESWCFLTTEAEGESLERIQRFAREPDGFKIAEIDLETRGAGNLEGDDQSGVYNLKLFDFLQDYSEIQKIITEAEKIGAQSEDWSLVDQNLFEAWLDEAESLSDGAH
jgi:ATP-dependent DNA helicase RecG